MTRELQAKFKAFKKEADAIVKRIAIERDKLRALVVEYENVLEAVDDAEQDFERAIDRLSGAL